MARTRDRTMDVKSFIKNNIDRLDAKYAEKHPDYCDGYGEVISGRQQHYDRRILDNAKGMMIYHYEDAIS